jgi:hypothetical protein
VSCDTRPRIYRTGARANPRPRPFVGGLHETGRDRVLQDVFERRLELLVGLDELGEEALAEDVVAAAVQRVERARVLAVEISHPSREVCVQRLDDEVVVVPQ